MIPDSAVEQARAASLREVVSRDVALKRVGRYWQALCPLHSEKTPSFYIMPGDQRFKCFGCGAHGNAIEYLRRTRGLDFQSAIEQLTSVPSGDSTRRQARDSAAAIYLPEPTPEQVRELWAGADAPNIAEFYLQSRGLLRHGALPAALRGHARVLYAEACGTEKPIIEPSWRTWRKWDEAAKQWIWWKGTHKPAMLAAISDAEGQVTALQRIWCERRYEVDASRAGPQDARARGLSTRKKTIGRMRNGAVRLVEPDSILGLAESVEDALAVAALYRLPCWAVCGVSRLGRNPPNVWIPPHVRSLLIFADNDEVGAASAHSAAIWWRRQGLETSVVLPEVGKDFNEMLLS